MISAMHLGFKLKIHRGVKIYIVHIYYLIIPAGVFNGTKPDRKTGPFRFLTCLDRNHESVQIVLICRKRIKMKKPTLHTFPTKHYCNSQYRRRHT